MNNTYSFLGFLCFGVSEMTEQSKREISRMNSLEFFIVSDFVRSCHFESSMGRELTFIFNSVNSVGKSVFLKIVFWLDFHHLFFIRVDILCFFRFFFFSLRLTVNENVLGISCERKRVELVGIIFVELIRRG